MKIEDSIIFDFIQWSESMEPKYELNAVDIEDVIRRYLNRVNRQSINLVKNIDKMPDVEIPEKYKSADWLLENNYIKKENSV